MKIKRVRISILLEGFALYAMRRTRASRTYLLSMVANPDSGADTIEGELRREVLGCDAALRYLGVRCLWRSAIITELLRRRGVAASICLSVSRVDPRNAHAECQIGGQTLRREDLSREVLR